MESNQSQSLSQRITEKIWLEKKKYNEAITNDKIFSEVKKIRLKIAKLIKELKVLSDEPGKPAYLIHSGNS